MVERSRQVRYVAYAASLLGAAALVAGFAFYRFFRYAGENAEGTRLLLVDVSARAGVDFTHENGARGKRYLPETTAGAAGWIDYDGDGWPDLYLVNANRHSDRGGEGEVTNRLYRNRGDGTFEDRTVEAGVGDRGYGCGLAVGDYDNDGHADLYVTNYGRNVLYRNAGNGRFRDVTDGAGAAVGGWSTSAAFFDADQDGDLDLYVCRYLAYDPETSCTLDGVPAYCSPKDFAGVADVLLRNRGDGTFEDVSEAAEIAVAGPMDGKSLGVVCFDYDDDGDADVYVACDQVRNLLFQNRGDGTFQECGLTAGVAYSSEGRSQAGMGVDFGDVDLNGHLDLVVTNFSDERHALYLNSGRGYFDEASVRFGLGGPTLEPLGFGACLVDFDADGDLDLYLANGHVQDTIGTLRPGMRFAQPDQLLENVEGRVFRDVSSLAGQWFVEEARVSRAAASADFDRDGRADLVVVASGGRAALLRNESRAGGRWIAFRLRGTRSNRDGHGARLTLEGRRGGAAVRRVFECQSARSYAAACEPTVRVGLGSGPEETVVEAVEIRWPSGHTQRLERPESGRVHVVTEQ